MTIDADDITARFFADHSHHKLLSRDKERDLFRRYADGDASARDDIVAHNVRLVRHEAGRYEGQGLPILDLIQEGMMGLLSAIEGFEVERGHKFSTYAVPWIRQAMRRAVAYYGDALRRSASAHSRIHAMRQTETRLAKELGREPTLEELAEAIDVPTRQMRTNGTKTTIEDLKTLDAGTHSLDAPMSETSGTTFLDYLADDGAQTPLDETAARETQAHVAALLETLTPREEDVLRRRYGIGGTPALTLREIGETYGLTQERIRQIEKQALRKLRREVLERGLLHLREAV